jgi:2-desacetyl-2-hydroxyethyl bacteriochlorophyllide A dehydrogenase
MNLELSEFEIDLADLGENDVIVKNRYSAISPGTELSIYTGINPKVYEPGSWCAYPFQPGYAGLGEVVATGHRVTEVKTGDFVFHNAHHASYDRMDSRYFPHVKISRETVIPEMAVVRFGAIVLSGAIRLAKIELGDNVALFGLGLMGQVAAQLFQLSGCEVVAFDPVESRRTVAEKIGACAEVRDPTRVNSKETIMLRSGGKGADILVDATGQASVVADNIGSVRRRGQVILLGTPHGESKADPTELLRQVHLNWITMIGALEQDFPLESTTFVKHSYAEDVSFVLRLITEGRLKTKELVSVIAPSEFQASYDGLLGPYEGRLNRREERIAVIVDWAKA